MRICTPHVGLFPSSNSGGVVYERELLKEMARQGAELEIILPKGQPYEQGIENWHIHPAPFGRGYRWYVSNLIFPPLIKKVYDKTHFQILRAHSLRFVGPAALWAKKYYNLPVPVVAHHHHIDDNLLNPFIEKQVLQACSLIITVSQFSKQQIAETFKIDTSHIEVVYNGIQAKFKPKPKNQDLLEKWQLKNRKVLLSLSGLKARKNLDALIKIFHIIATKMPNQVVLIIAGTGPEEPKLKALVHSLGLANDVRFTGFVEEADKVDIYNLADVYVSASKMEGFGMTPVEAMACGVPAVVSNAGALPEVVVQEQTGFVISTDIPEQFAAKIITLLTETHLAHQFGKAGQRHVSQHFSWDSAAQQTRQLYQNLLFS